MATIYVDNRPYTVKDGHNLLYACLSLRMNLPYFCWHPAMHSIGACRQCAVKQFKDEHDAKGRIVMACMTQAMDGARISINDPEAREFREAVIEFLMTNHPHDCPVCDEGGECHLQDMTLMTGHTYRRYRLKKRTYRNQYLGPFLTHEMNRCIACYRCVRYYQDYAGGRDLDVFYWHNDVYFGRYKDGVLENEFSGNLVEVCPTGVFTDKTLSHHYARKWDLQTAPSVCTHCGVGCNTIPGERQKMLRRIRNRYNKEVNGYFLCDRGRYGYEFVNSPLRVRRPLLRRPRGSPEEPIQKDAAIEYAASILRDPSRVIGIGSPRASLEANFALRTLVGPERFYRGMSDTDCHLVSEAMRLLRTGPARAPTIEEVRQSDAVFILGEDITNTAPVLALNVRQATFQKEINLAKRLHIPFWDDAAVREAIQQKRGPLFIATPVATRLDDVATHVYNAAPDDLVRFAYGVAHALEAQVPWVEDFPEDLRQLVDVVAEALYAAEHPLVIAGTSLGSAAVLHAATNVAWALCAHGHPGQLHFAFPECNSAGMGLIGGGGMNAAMQAIREGKADTVVILENDLWRRADEASVRALFDAAEHVIVIDHLDTETAARADLVLPAATFAEGDGTFVNNEGRGQRFYQVFVPEGDVQESWCWINELRVATGQAADGDWKDLDDLLAAMAETLPELAPVRNLPPPPNYRIAGQKIPRETHRASGRTALYANITVHEPPPPPDPDSPYTFSTEGFSGQPPGLVTPRFWVPGWNSVQSVTRFQEEVNGPLEGGTPGRRLIEPDPKAEIRYFGDVPGAFHPRPGQWLAVPLYHIFGSEELSAQSAGVAELTPKPYLALNPEDAWRLGVKEGDAVEFSTGQARHQVVVTLLPTLAAGTAGVPFGLPGMPTLAPLAWLELQPVPAELAAGPGGSP